MAQESDYGAKFDGIVAVVMALLIVAAFVGVIALQKATHEDCTASDYTYCEPHSSAHE